MHVLFVTSEVAGVFKIGGLADVSLSLPRALVKKGVRVTVALPFYKAIHATGVSGVGRVSVEWGKKREIVFLFSKPLGQTGATLLLFRHPLLDDYNAPGIEERFAFYSKVIAGLKVPFDIIHCHDWHTALVPLLMAGKARTIVTIHNLMYQGVVDSGIIDYLHAPRDKFHILKNPHGDRVSLLREGLEYADSITTVSPTYAKEIVTTFHRDAIGDVLQRRRSHVSGILNGIDPEIWNPAVDKAVSEPYTPHSVFTVKSRLKALLQKEVGFPRVHVPLFAFVGRIEPNQKGIDIVIKALGVLLKKEAMQVVFLGTGDPKTVRALLELAKAHKDSVRFIHAFDDSLARKIYAGADVLLVPSKYEPCGLTQMIAMAYGTIPLVRATGGLADTVVDGVTGFVFDEYSGRGLSGSIRRAITMWKEDPAAWKKIIHNGMKQDFSWDKSAKEYISLYHKLLSI